MTRLEWMIYVGMPLAIFCAYLLGWALMPTPSDLVYRWVFSEQGLIEMSTAILFALAAVGGVGLLCSTSKRMAQKYRFIYGGFALAAIFVALEETSYGQHFFDFPVPEWFARNSTKHEVNFHNLYGNKPARRLNLVATMGFPVVCVLLPLLLLLRCRTYPVGGSAYHLLPRTELIVIVVLAQAATWLDDLSGLLSLPPSAWARASEFKEFYWGMTAFFHCNIIRRRLGSGTPLLDGPHSPPSRATTRHKASKKSYARTNSIGGGASRR